MAMRGQAQLETMRRRGRVPDAVMLHTNADERLRMWQDWAERTPNIAFLESSGAPVQADLRCVVGLTVNVHGDDAARVRRWFDACVKAKAGRVVAFVTVARGAETFECAEVLDSKGLLTWPQ